MNKKYFFCDEKGNQYPEWESKSLNDVADFINGFAFKPDDLGASGTTVVKIKEMLDPSDLSVKTTLNVPHSVHLKNGDVIFSWSMTLACRIWNGGPAILNQHLYKVVNKKNYDSKFINYLLNSELTALRNLMHGGTAKHITRKDLLPYKVMTPSLPEQQKISEFFSALDERIALTADKAKLLKEQKAGYLQKVFSRELVLTDDNGDTYDEWEQKKLADIAEFINGFAFKPDDLGSEGTPVVKIKELLDPSDLSVKTTINVPKSLHLKNGDIILSWSMTLACRIWSGGPAILNQHLYKVVGKENNDSRFLNYLLNNELAGLRNLMHGGTAKHITRKDLLPYKVMMPSLPEQKKIGEFFSALDEQIELTENKLALLKEQKKGYLQGIFG